ncbi:hypothetical protein EAE99_011573 [Botrytis elliptica]|nr:hypothetical protein EAE99_011573 [Botrytis elliptica]
MREDDHIFLHILRKQDETNFFNIKKLLFESEYANQKSWDAALVTLSLDEVADNENVLRLIRKATTDDVTKTLASERLAPKSSASSGTKSQSSPHPSLSNLHKQQKTTSTSKESLPPYTTPSSRTQRTPQAPRKSQHSSTITSINPEIHHYVDLMSHATTSQSSIPKIQLVDKCGIFELPLLNSYDIAKEVKSEVEKDDKKHDDNMGNNDGDNIYEGLARWTDPLVSPTPASKGPSSKPPRSLLSSEHSDVDSEEEEEEEFGIPISERRRLSITATDGEAIINNFASNFCTALCKYVKPSSPGSPFISNPLSSRTHTDTNGNHVSRTYRMVPIQQKFSFGPTRRNDKNNWGFNAAVDAVIRTDCNQGHFQSLQAKGKEGKVKDEKAHIRKPKREISYNEQGKMPCLPLLCAEFKASSEPKDIYIQEDAELAAIIYEKWYGMGRDGVEDKDDSS